MGYFWCSRRVGVDICEEDIVEKNLLKVGFRGFEGWS